MTRVSSYTLYQCPSCGQIHIKNEYGSVSVYVPIDLYFDPTDEKSCQKCGKVSQLKDYLCLGIKPKTVRVEKTYSNNILGRIYKMMHEFFCPPKDLDLQNFYPFL